MKEWMKEWMNEWINEEMNKWKLNDRFDFIWNYWGES